MRIGFLFYGIPLAFILFLGMCRSDWHEVYAAHCRGANIIVKTCTCVRLVSIIISNENPNHELKPVSLFIVSVCLNRR